MNDRVHELDGSTQCVGASGNFCRSFAPPVARCALRDPWQGVAFIDTVTGSPVKCNVRNLTMHFIRFPSLEPRKSYKYLVGVTMLGARSTRSVRCMAMVLQPTVADQT